MNEIENTNTPQPQPTPNNHPAVWDLVIADMQERDQIGELKYGTRLKTFNGRDALIDLTQELMDGIVYLRQFREEMSCLGKNLLEIQNVLAESQFLSREDCASLADSLMQSLRKNPALCVG